MLPPSSGGGSGPACSSSLSSLSQVAEGMKCQKFLVTLLGLAKEQSMGVARKVDNLIQGLVDGKLEPEAFVAQLPRELGSSQQPDLVKFLKESLPHLSQMWADSGD